MISLPYLCRKTDITLSYVTNSLQEKKIQNKNCNKVNINLKTIH